MTPRRTVWLLCWLLLVLASSPTARSEPEPPLATFGERIDVRLFSIRVRAVDHFGAPLPGLRPHDFEVEIGGREIELVAVDWVAGGTPAEAERGGALDREAPAQESRDDDPRLVVLFLQTSAEPHRYLGHWRVLKRLDRLLAGLAPRDRVAVVAFQYHLQVRSHFTERREETRAAVESAVRLRSRPPALLAGDGPELEIDAVSARDAALVERGLEVVGRALSGLPGEKLLLFLGWGLGVEHGGAVTRHYVRAVQALREASVTVSSMAVGSQSFGVSSNLDFALARIAVDTGGQYVKLAPFLDLAVERLRRSLDGHYLVTFAVPDGVTGRVRVGLRSGPFRVHHAPFVLEGQGLGPGPTAASPLAR